MKKILIPIEIILLTLLQIFISIALSFKYPVFLFLLIPSILILFPRNWIRIISLVMYFFALSLSVTVFIYSLIAIENKIGQPILVITASLAFAVFFIYLITDLLFRSKIKNFYIEGSRSGLLIGTEIPTQWICPKCNSKIRYSIRCWNCGEAKPGTETKADDLSNSIK
ncbi:MAG: zinc ribbon domain-containing protein [Candidatus Theseobacter exili]|nr:zinc ribbon domain-containing protein [Candidatus Theseobacter exili]